MPGKTAVVEATGPSTTITGLAERATALLATTIVESGLDIPNANTLIVDRADTFGLAQLYQLRGRVGRGEHASFCVLLADPKTGDIKEYRTSKPMSGPHGLVMDKQGNQIAALDIGVAKELAREVIIVREVLKRTLPKMIAIQVDLAQDLIRLDACDEAAFEFLEREHRRPNRHGRGQGRVHANGGDLPSHHRPAGADGRIGVE